MARDIEWEKHVARLMAEQKARTPTIGARVPGGVPLQQARRSLPERVTASLPTPASRDAARMVLHGLARTGNTILRAIDIPNRVFGNTRSVLQDIYEKSEVNLERDAYEDQSGIPQVGETAVHLASAGVLGKALPAVFGANVGADTYETAKYAGASEGEALAKGVGHGVVDTAIWTLGQGLASKYLPEAWQWLGRELTGATRGAASSVTSDAVLNSLGADISGEEMAKRAAHAAWMVPLLGMLKMGGKRREEAMSLLKKARPDLAGAKADKVIETIEAEFSDPKSQKVALAWVARKGANLPDDTAQIRQALEVSSKVKGLNPMSRSPFEILSDPAYARYLPKPRPQDVKAFSNMKRYPMGVIGFDVSDDAAGRQATREMINAYMSPSSNPWCLATGKDAAKLGELGPGAEGYWKQHSAVPKQIFFQEVDGKLELTAFRATSSGGEGRQEYWDTSDAGYSGIPIKVKVPGDPMGRYRKMVFRPAGQQAPDTVKLTPNGRTEYNEEQLREYIAGRRRNLEAFQARPEDFAPDAVPSTLRDIELAERGLETLARRKQGGADGEVQGTFEDIAPGKVFKGDPFRDGHSQTWSYGGSDKVPFRVSIGGHTSSFSSIQAAERELVRLQNEPPPSPYGMSLSEMDAEYRRRNQEISELKQAIQSAKTNASRLDKYYLTEDKERTTENGITKFRTTKYADPTNWDYEPPKPGEAQKPVEIEESELVSPEWMRARGYDPESESDVRRMQQDLNIQAWGNGQEAAMAVVPTKRTYMQTESGSPETVTYGPNGRDVVSVDFEKDGVPYREEYFHSGPRDTYVPGLLGDREALGIAELPGPSRDYIGINEPNGFRLTRNPGGESPEVLDEIKWDDGLGGFVRTSGNKRWRPGTSDRPEDLSFWDTDNGRGELYQEYLDGRVTQDEVRSELNRYLSELDSEFADTRGLDHDLNLLETVPRDEIRGVASIEDWGIVTEERQSDGTWTNARSTVVPERAQQRLSAKRAQMIEGTPDDPPDDWLIEDFDMNGEPIPYDGDGTPTFAAKAGRTRRDVSAAAKGGDEDRFSMSRNFFATDKVPDSIFGIRIVADEKDYTPEDLAFFREHPEAGGYYDMGDEEEAAPEEPAEEQPMQAASKAGDTWTWETYRWNPEARGGRKIDPKNIKDTGVSFDAAKERLQVPKGQEAEFERWMDNLANLPSTIKANGRDVPIKSFLVPKDWRTNTEYNRDYDYVAAFLADAKPGPLDHGPEAGWFWHMGDAGKMPTHPTFSRESYYARDPRYSDLAGDWEGETYIPGKAERAVRQDAKGGKARGRYPGKLNNPGNVEKRAERRRGEIASPHERWAKFATPQDGLREMADVIRQIADVKLAEKDQPFTIRNFAEIYAPRFDEKGEPENDTDKYIRDISSTSGIGADAVLDRWNTDDMAKLLKTVVRFESGVPHSEWFTDDEYRAAAGELEEGAID